MTTEEDIKGVVNEMQGSGKTFAEFLAVLFKDKLVEIYLGDSYEEVSLEQTSMSYPAVICGRVIAAYRECLIVSCAYIDPIAPGPKGNDNKQGIKFGNNLFISERAIRALNEIDGRGVLEDMLLRSRESLDVRRLYQQK